MNGETIAERALSDFSFNTEWVSQCCGSYCLGHLECFNSKSASGICNDCHEHAMFEPADEGEDDDAGSLAERV